MESKKCLLLSLVMFFLSTPFESFSRGGGGGHGGGGGGRSFGGGGRSFGGGGRSFGGGGARAGGYAARGSGGLSRGGYSRNSGMGMGRSYASTAGAGRYARVSPGGASSRLNRSTSTLSGLHTGSTSGIAKTGGPTGKTGIKSGTARTAGTAGKGGASSGKLTGKTGGMKGSGGKSGKTGEKGMGAKGIGKTAGGKMGPKTGSFKGGKQLAHSKNLSGKNKQHVQNFNHHWNQHHNWQNNWWAGGFGWGGFGGGFWWNSPFWLLSPWWWWGIGWNPWWSYQIEYIPVETTVVYQDLPAEEKESYVDQRLAILEQRVNAITDGIESQTQALVELSNKINKLSDEAV